MDSLKIKNLNYSYGSKIVLKNINLEVKKGEFVCLCGPNGSGKSTLLQQIEKLTNNKKIKNTAFLQQNEFCAWDTTVFNLILSGRFIWSKGHFTENDYKVVKESASILNISDLLERSVYSLSGGEFQKARIARTLTQETDFLLLDEPCANLDFTVEKELLTLFQELAHKSEKGILISIHDINAAARFADRIELLPPVKNNPEGGLISGNAENIFTDENIRKTYGEGLKIFRHPENNYPQIY